MAVATITFDSVYTADGEKNGKEWKRWDFKAGDDRYSTFQKKLADKIEKGVPVTIEYEEKKSGDYWNRTIIDVTAGNQQEGSGSQNGSQAGRTSPVASQGHSEKPDWDAIARGKVKSNLWVSLVAVMFQSLPKAEQSVEAASQLVDYAMGEIFPEDVPF